MRVFSVSVFMLLLATFVHAQTLVPKDMWVLHDVDSEAIFGGEANQAINAFDGDISSIWYTEWSNSVGVPPPPHHIAIDIGESLLLSGFIYTPTQASADHGRIDGYEFYTSVNGDWVLQAAGNFPNTTVAQTVMFEPVTAQLFKLVATSSHNGPWTTLAELGVFEIPLYGDLLTFNFSFIEPSVNDDGTSLDDLAACTIQWSMGDNQMTDEVFIASTPMGGVVQNRTVGTDVDLSIDFTVNASAFCKDTSGNMSVPLHIDPFIVSGDTAPQGFSSATVTITFN